MQAPNEGARLQDTMCATSVIIPIHFTLAICWINRELHHKNVLLLNDNMVLVKKEETNLPASHILNLIANHFYFRPRTSSSRLSHGYLLVNKRLFQIWSRKSGTITFAGNMQYFPQQFSPSKARFLFLLEPWWWHLKY